MGEGIFKGFGGGSHGADAEATDAASEAPVAPASDSPANANVTEPGPRADAPIQATAADTASSSDQQTPAAAPEIVPGVPLWTFENPYGDDGISWLASLDLEARHEVDQPAQHPGTDTTAARPMQRSGGAAYYVNLLTGRGFSVPVNPEGV